MHARGDFSLGASQPRKRAHESVRPGGARVCFTFFFFPFRANRLTADRHCVSLVNAAFRGASRSGESARGTKSLASPSTHRKFPRCVRRATSSTSGSPKKRYRMDFLPRSLGTFQSLSANIGFDQSVELHRGGSRRNATRETNCLLIDTVIDV